MKGRINYSPSYDIGLTLKKQNEKTKILYGPNYRSEEVSRKYISFIEELIRQGRMDKARDLILRSDRFPENFSVYLRRYSLEHFINLFPNLQKKRPSKNFDNLLIK